VKEYIWREISAENHGPSVVTATARARIAIRPNRTTNGNVAAGSLLGREHSPVPASKDVP